MWPVRRADNLTTFMCRLSWNLGVSTSWNTLGLCRSVLGLLYLYLYLTRMCNFYRQYIFIDISVLVLLTAYKMNGKSTLKLRHTPTRLHIVISHKRNVFIPKNPKTSHFYRYLLGYNAFPIDKEFPILCRSLHLLTWSVTMFFTSRKVNL
jgi:hypothetical protein